MNLVTYNNIRLKCYLNFIYLASHEVKGSPMVAKAINKFQTTMNDLKKRGTCLILTYFRLQIPGLKKIVFP